MELKTRSCFCKSHSFRELINCDIWYSKSLMKLLMDNGILLKNWPSLQQLDNAWIFFSDIVIVGKASLIENGALLRSAECADSASSTLTTTALVVVCGRWARAGHYLFEHFLDNLKNQFCFVFWKLYLDFRTFGDLLLTPCHDKTISLPRPGL